MGVPTRGLIAAYKMDELVGGLMIDEVGGHNGVVSGPVLVPGKIGKGLSFGGHPHYIDIPHASVFNTTKLTISLWVKANRKSNDLAGLVFKGATTNPSNWSYSIMVNPAGSANGAINCGVSNGSTIFQFHSVTQSVAEFFTNVIMRIDGNTVDLFVNGLLENSLVFSGTRVQNSEKITLGRVSSASTTGRYLEGSIDLLRFYNVALDIDEITDLASEESKKLQLSISENLAATDFLVRAHRLYDGALSKFLSTDQAEIEIDLETSDQFAHLVTVSPDIGNNWMPESSAIVGQKCFPTDPSGTPYYFRCTIAGNTGATEPAWQTGTPGALTSDGTAEWELVERIPQPITHGPLIPQ